jgi:hypothetical protein
MSATFPLTRGRPTTRLASAALVALVTVLGVALGGSAPASAAPGDPTPFGDWDGDGWSDLLVRDVANGGALRIYRGSASGLSGPTQISSAWNGMNAIVRHGDMGGDAHEDLVARQGNTGELFLYPGTGKANPNALSSRIRIGASGWNAMSEITLVGDLDGDSKGDLIAVQTSTGQLFLYPGRGAAPFGVRRLIGSTGWNGMNELTGMGDVTGDGKVDLLARQAATSDIQVYPGTGTGASSRFGSPTMVGSGHDGWRRVQSFVGIGDIDRDGSNDLAAVETYGWSLRAYGLKNGHLYTTRHLGSGFTSNYRPMF